LSSRISGRIGEDAVIAYLKKRGHRIITANYNTGGGELDIVSVKNGVLVFTEVKTKTTVYRGAPWEELTPHKAAALKRAAASFMRVDGTDRRVPYYVGPLRFTLGYRAHRFDLAEVCVRHGKAQQIIYTKNVL